MTLWVELRNGPLLLTVGRDSSELKPVGKNHLSGGFLYLHTNPTGRFRFKQTVGHSANPVFVLRSRNDIEVGEAVNGCKAGCKRLKGDGTTAVNTPAGNPWIGCLVPVEENQRAFEIHRRHQILWRWQLVEHHLARIVAEIVLLDQVIMVDDLSLIHISEPTRLDARSRMPSSA